MLSGARSETPPPASRFPLTVLPLLGQVRLPERRGCAFFLIEFFFWRNKAFRCPSFGKVPMCTGPALGSAAPLGW